MNPGSNVFLYFRKKCLILSRFSSGEQKLAILHGFQIDITNRIYNGNPEDIRFFEFGGIFRIMLEKQRRKESEACDMGTIWCIHKLSFQESVEREYFGLFLGIIHEKNPSPLREEIHIIRAELVLFQSCLYIADIETKSERDDISPFFFLNRKRFGAV